jgi:hypothetical protein
MMHTLETYIPYNKKDVIMFQVGHFIMTKPILSIFNIKLSMKISNIKPIPTFKLLSY